MLRDCSAMTDVLTREQRRTCMSHIRGRDTRPELAVRSALHRAGYRFRLHDKKLPGRPDIVLPKYRTALLVHGCFWHRHPGCRFATTPATRPEFWSQKFAANVRRDAEVREQLEAQGWSVAVIWECETRDAEVLREAIHRILPVRALEPVGNRPNRPVGSGS